MLKDIAEYLCLNGFNVDVFSSMPSYHGSQKGGVPHKEILNNVRVTRCWLFPEPGRHFLLRLVNSVLFSLRAFLQVLFSKDLSIVMAATTPPLMISLLVSIGCKLRGISFIYHMQDIYPEIAYYSGSIRSNWIYGLLRKIDSNTLRRCSSAVVLSDDMRIELQKRNTNTSISVINNFIRSNAIIRTSFDFEKYEIDKSLFKIVYCGNIGKFQNLDVIIKAFKKLNSRNAATQLIFVGDGIERDRLEQLVIDEDLSQSVVFTGYQDFSTIGDLLEQSQLGLIPIVDNLHRVAYPSKTMTNLYYGLSSLVLVNPESELARFIKGNKIGYVASPNDENAIVDSMVQALTEHKDDFADKSRITRIAKSEFGRKGIMEQWQKLILGILRERDA